MANAPVVPQVPIKVNPYSMTCDPDPAKAAKGQPTTFVFVLENPNIWEWQGTSPVVVDDKIGDQFPFPSHVQPNAGAVILHDNNTNKKNTPYKYKVTVSNKITGDIVVIDPYIENQ